MLGLFFIYWIWKAFSNLANRYRKSRWKFFFLGLGSYYLAVILSVFIVMVLLGLIKGFDVVADENYESGGWNLFYLLSGASGCYGCYKFLEFRAEKERELINNDEIENIGVLEEN